LRAFEIDGEVVRIGVEDDSLAVREVVAVSGLVAH
jgi:hypothetical protein